MIVIIFIKHSPEIIFRKEGVSKLCSQYSKHKIKRSVKGISRRENFPFEIITNKLGNTGRHLHGNKNSIFDSGYDVLAKCHIQK